MIPVRQRLVERLHLPTAPRQQATPHKQRVFDDPQLRYERWSIPARRGVVPAWFVVPKQAQSPLPVLLALHPHGRQFEIAKSWVVGLVGEASRAYGRAAARAGFAVLAPDLVGFEEHRPSLHERKSSYALQGEAYERLLGNQASVLGETLQGWIVDDLQHCIDALQAEERIDAERLACMGHSFGGQETVFSMLCDERIRAGVVSCGFSLVAHLVTQNISHNMALYVPGLLPELDFDSLVPGIAPRALRVLAGRHDAIYPVAGVQRVEAAARAAWEGLGAGDRLQFRYLEAGHDLSEVELQLALRWLQEVLA